MISDSIGLWLADSITAPLQSMNDLRSNFEAKIVICVHSYSGCEVIREGSKTK
jgi:hypothetical protein